jgi:hypothetical protein
MGSFLSAPKRWQELLAYVLRRVPVVQHGGLGGRELDLDGSVPQLGEEPLERVGSSDAALPKARQDARWLVTRNQALPTTATRRHGSRVGMGQRNSTQQIRR